MYTSVIVPTYNRREIFERTLNALLNQTVSSDAFEIIVVDDCSPDDTEAFMKGKVESTPNLAYIRHTENQGRAVTRNDGIVAARGDLVVFLDDDIVPEPDFVEAHNQYHMQYGDEHIAVMGNVRYASEVIAGSNFLKYLQSRYLGFRSPNQRSAIDYSNLLPRFLGTGNCSMRRVDLIKVGMLDTDFRYYGGEDEYLGYCLYKAGIRIIFGERTRSEHYDDLSMQKYKKKIIEATSMGYSVILRKEPKYFESTQVRFLLPVDWKNDSVKRVLIKLSLRLFLNPATIVLLEQWAVLTDKYSQLYFQPVYRLLVAGWGVLGFREKQQNVRLVTYGES